MSDAHLILPRQSQGGVSSRWRAWPGLLFGTTLVLLGLVILWIVLGDADRAGYSALYLLAAASAMFASIALSLSDSGDVLSLSSAIPIAYFLFVFPGSLVLVLNLPGADVVKFTVGYHQVFVDPDSIGRALEMICGGSVAYFVGLLFCLTRGAARRREEFEYRRVPVDLGRCILIAITALSLYCVVASGVAGSVGEMLRCIYDPVSREKMSEVWFRNLPGFLALVFLVAVTLAFAKLVAEGAGPALLLCGVGFVIAFVICLPYGNRQFVLTSAVYPLFMWHYLRRRIGVAHLAACQLLLPYFATFFLDLRQGNWGGEGLASRAWGAFAYESNMVNVFSAAVSSFRSGGIGYEWGRDLLLVFTWFIPRGLWPDKAWPLDYRLALSLGLADPNQPSGAPITIFGGLWLNFTEYGMVILLLLLGYYTMRLQRRLRTGNVDSVFWRAIIFFYLVDMTRVGDIVREFWTAAVQVGGFLLVRYFLGVGMRGVRMADAQSTHEGGG